MEGGGGGQGGGGGGGGGPGPRPTINVVIPPSVPLSHFDPAVMALETWLQMFQSYCTHALVPEEPAAGPDGVVADNRRRALFLSAMGPRVFEALRCATLPRLPRELPIAQLTTLLRERCLRNHEPDTCPARHYKCNACKDKGHYAKACPKKKSSAHVNFAQPGPSSSSQDSDAQRLLNMQLEDEVSRVFNSQ